MTNKQPCVTYNEALVVFRDLCDDSLPQAFTSEYVRGGVNLIADLFGIVERPVDERMDNVLADLRRIPMFADPGKLARYGVKPYERGEDSDVYDDSIERAEYNAHPETRE